MTKFEFLNKTAREKTKHPQRGLRCAFYTFAPTAAFSRNFIVKWRRYCAS